MAESIGQTLPDNAENLENIIDSDSVETTHLNQFEEKFPGFMKPFGIDILERSGELTREPEDVESKPIGMAYTMTFGKCLKNGHYLTDSVPDDTK